MLFSLQTYILHICISKALEPWRAHIYTLANQAKRHCMHTYISICTYVPIHVIYTQLQNTPKILMSTIIEPHDCTVQRRMRFGVSQNNEEVGNIEGYVYGFFLIKKPIHVYVFVYVHVLCIMYACMEIDVSAKFWLTVLLPYSANSNREESASAELP